MSRVAVVSTLKPDAPATGKSVMWGGLWQFLAERVGRDRFTYIFVGQRQPEPTDLGIHVRWVAQPSVREQLGSLATTVAWGGRPFQEAAIAHARVARQIRNILDEVAAETVLADTHRVGVMLRPPRSHRLLTYMDDLFSIRYDRMLGAIRDWPDEDFDPLGNFTGHLPRVAARFTSIRASQRWLLANERRRVGHTELEVPRLADLALLINPHEAELLRTRTGCDNVMAIPPAVPDQPHARRAPNPDHPSYVFLGAMNVPHNDMAVRAFLAHGFGTLLSERPGATFEIVGRHVGKRLRDAAQPFGPSVRFHGFVDDLTAIMSTATAVVAPLVFGSGVKIKVIEALARGVPVVATSVGAEGIEFDGSEHPGIVIMDEWSGFARACAALTDTETNSLASVAARRAYEVGYAPSVVEAAYERLLL